MKIKDAVDIWAEQQAKFSKDLPVPPLHTVTHYHAAGETASTCRTCKIERKGVKTEDRYQSTMDVSIVVG